MSHRILLVEDNDMNRDVLARLLARRGFQVATAVDGEGALETAGREPPHLVLMDVSLPGIDGHETTRRMHRMQGLESLPIIALTAHALMEDRDLALAAGCTDFETKPVDLARLLAKIRTLLPDPA